MELIEMAPMIFGLVMLATIVLWLLGSIGTSRLCKSCGGRSPKKAKFCRHCGKPFSSKIKAEAEMKAFYVKDSNSGVVRMGDGTLFISGRNLLSWMNMKTGDRPDSDLRSKLGSFYNAAALAGPIELMEGGVPLGETRKLVLEAVKEQP